MDAATVRAFFPSVTDEDIATLTAIYASFDAAKAFVNEAAHLPHQTKTGMLQQIAATAHNVALAVVVQKPRN